MKTDEIYPYYLDYLNDRMIEGNIVNCANYYQQVKEILITDDIISGNTPYCLFYRKKKIT